MHFSLRRLHSLLQPPLAVSVPRPNETLQRSTHHASDVYLPRFAFGAVSVASAGADRLGGVVPGSDASTPSAWGECLTIALCRSRVLA